MIAPSFSAVLCLFQIVLTQMLAVRIIWLSPRDCAAANYLL